MTRSLSSKGKCTVCAWTPLIRTLEADRDRYREALETCAEAFHTINASNGATRRAEAAIREALDG